MTPPGYDFQEGQLKLGAPLDETSDIGTIINEKQFSKVCGYVEEGLKRREARVVIGGLPPKEGRLAKAITQSPPSSRMRRTTGAWPARRSSAPCLSPSLGATRRTRSVWPTIVTTDSLPTFGHTTLAGHSAAHAIEAGWVQVNQGLGQSPGHSYGGYKESGIGREFSLEGMLESYTQRKNVTVNLTH
jgi:acyl-CoA reductase-like NAD-dependent aldehyde dehydrogenase